MTTTPWWTTIAAALAGGALTLFATVLTTIAANHHAARRMKIELLHRTFLEREKALYESRLTTYTELIKLASELEDLVPTPQDQHVERTTVRQVEQVRHAANGLMKLKDLLVLISGEDVGNAFADLITECSRLLKVSQEGRRLPSADASIWKRLDAATSRLVAAIRHEIGADLDEGMDTSLPARRGRYRAVAAD